MKRKNRKNKINQDCAKDRSLEGWAKVILGDRYGKKSKRKKKKA